MKFALKMLAGIATITICAVLLMFAIPAYATHTASQTCTTIKEDVEHLQEQIALKNSIAKAWLWSDEGFSIIMVATPLTGPGKIIISFYNDKGCLMLHPYTGQIRTVVDVTDKLKAYIARSKLFWSNTDKILLTSAGYAI